MWGSQGGSRLRSGREVLAEVPDEVRLAPRQDAVGDGGGDPALREGKHPKGQDGAGVPGWGLFWVSLALRSTLSSQVTRVQPGSPASGCSAMQLSRVSALRWAKKGNFRRRGSLWLGAAGSPPSPGALPDAALLRRQPLEARGGAHQVDGRLCPPAVPHAHKVPAAHGAGGGHLVRHQRVLAQALQHLWARRARSAASSHPDGMLTKAKRACLPPHG